MTYPINLDIIFNSLEDFYPYTRFMPHKRSLTVVTFLIIWLILLNCGDSSVITLMNQGGYEACQKTNPKPDTDPCTSTLYCKRQNSVVECDDYISCKGCQVEPGDVDIECQWSYSSCDSDKCVFISSTEGCPAYDKRQRQCCLYYCSVNQYKPGTILSPEQLLQNYCFSTPPRQKSSICDYETVTTHIHCIDGNNMIVDCKEPPNADQPFQTKWELPPATDGCTYNQLCKGEEDGDMAGLVPCECSACGQPLFYGPCMASHKSFGGVDQEVSSHLCSLGNDSDGGIHGDPDNDDDPGNENTQFSSLFSDCSCTQVCSHLSFPLTIGKPYPSDIGDGSSRGGSFGECDQDNYFTPPSNVCEPTTLYRNIYCVMGGIILEHGVCIKSIRDNITQSNVTVTLGNILEGEHAIYPANHIDTRTNGDIPETPSPSPSPSPEPMGILSSTLPLIFSNQLRYVPSNQQCKQELVCMASGEPSGDPDTPRYVSCDTICNDKCGESFSITRVCAIPNGQCRKNPVTGAMVCESYTPLPARSDLCDSFDEGYASSRKLYVSQLGPDTTKMADNDKGGGSGGGGDTKDNIFFYTTSTSCPCDEWCVSNTTPLDTLDYTKDLQPCDFTPDKVNQQINGGAFGSPLHLEQFPCLYIFTRQVVLLSSVLSKYLRSHDPGSVPSDQLYQYKAIPHTACTGDGNQPHCRITPKAPYFHLFSHTCTPTYACVDAGTTFPPELSDEIKCDRDNLTTGFPQCSIDNCGNDMERKVYCYFYDMYIADALTSLAETFREAGLHDLVDGSHAEANALCKANPPQTTSKCQCGKYKCAPLGTSQQPQSTWPQALYDCDQPDHHFSKGCPACKGLQKEFTREIFCQIGEQYVLIDPNGNMPSLCDSSTFPPLTAVCDGTVECVASWKCSPFSQVVVPTEHTKQLRDGSISPSSQTASEHSVGQHVSVHETGYNVSEHQQHHGLSVLNDLPPPPSGKGMQELTGYDSDCSGLDQFSQICYQYYPSQSIYMQTTCVGSGYRLRYRQCVNYYYNPGDGLFISIPQGFAIDTECQSAANNDDPYIQHDVIPCSVFDGCSCGDSILTGPDCDIPPNITNIAWLYRSNDYQWEIEHPGYTIHIPPRRYVTDKMPTSFVSPQPYRIGRVVYLYWEYMGNPSNDVLISLIPVTKTLSSKGDAAIPITLHRTEAVAGYAQLQIPSTLSSSVGQVFIFSLSIGSYTFTMSKHPIIIETDAVVCGTTKCNANNLLSEKPNETCTEVDTRAICQCRPLESRYGSFDDSCSIPSGCQPASTKAHSPSPSSSLHVMKISLQQDISVRPCLNGGYYGWAPTSPLSGCASSCTCPGLLDPKTQCSQCPLTCNVSKEAGVLDRETCSCKCVLGFYGDDCDACSAFGVFTFTNIPSDVLNFLFESQRNDQKEHVKTTSVEAQAHSGTGMSLYTSFMTSIRHVASLNTPLSLGSNQIRSNGHSIVLSDDDRNDTQNNIGDNDGIGDNGDVGGDEEEGEEQEDDDDDPDTSPLLTLSQFISLFRSYLSSFFGVPSDHIQIQPENITINRRNQSMRLIVDLIGACETPQELETLPIAKRSKYGNISIFTLFEFWEQLNLYLLSSVKLTSSGRDMDRQTTSLNNTLQHNDHHDHQHPHHHPLIRGGALSHNSPAPHTVSASLSRASVSMQVPSGGHAAPTTVSPLQGIGGGGAIPSIIPLTPRYDQFLAHPLFQSIGREVSTSNLYAPKCTGQRCPKGTTPFTPDSPCPSNDPSCGQPTPEPNSNDKRLDDSALYTIIGVVIGILFLLAVGVILFCCCCTNRKISETQEVQELEMI